MPGAGCGATLVLGSAAGAERAVPAAASAATAIVARISAVTAAAAVIRTAGDGASIETSAKLNPGGQCSESASSSRVAFTNRRTLGLSHHNGHRVARRGACRVRNCRSPEVNQMTARREPIEYANASAEVRAVYDDIMAIRKTDWVKNFWKVLASEPAPMRRRWSTIKQARAPGATDRVTKA